MSHRRPKNLLYAQLARVGKAAASPRRLELLEVLAQGERVVEVLARETGQSVANTSHHLQVLRESGLVQARKAGLYVFYRLTEPGVYDLARMIRALAERHVSEVGAMVEMYFTDRDHLEPVAREGLLERARAGTVTVLDVRPVEEYRSGHIPGAVSIPINQLEKRMRQLPVDGEFVAYCRGPYCVMAFQAVELLRKRGRSARRLRDGFPEWRAAGLPVEVRGKEEAA